MRNAGYQVSISSVTGGVLGTPSSAQVDIIDDELPPNISITDVVLEEGNPGPGNPTVRAVFTVRMTTAMPIGVSVPYTLHDISATRGVDYTQPFYLNVYFARGETSFTLSADIISDRDPEGDETFSIELGTPSPSAGITVTKSIGTCKRS